MKAVIPNCYLEMVNEIPTLLTGEKLIIAQKQNNLEIKKQTNFQNELRKLRSDIEQLAIAVNNKNLNLRKWYCK